VSGNGISWAICKSAPRSRQVTMPASHHSVFYRLDALPAAQPTVSKHWSVLHIIVWYDSFTIFLCYCHHSCATRDCDMRLIVFLPVCPSASVQACMPGEGILQAVCHLTSSWNCLYRSWKNTETKTVLWALSSRQQHQGTTSLRRHRLCPSVKVMSVPAVVTMLTT